VFARPIKAPSVNAERLERLIARWHESAKLHPSGESEKEIDWAEHLKRLAAVDESRARERDDRDKCTPTSPAQRAA